jgi:hypothetical protein
MRQSFLVDKRKEAIGDATSVVELFKIASLNHTVRD